MAQRDGLPAGNEEDVGLVAADESAVRGLCRVLVFPCHRQYLAQMLDGLKTLGKAGVPMPAAGT